MSYCCEWLQIVDPQLGEDAPQVEGPQEEGPQEEDHLQKEDSQMREEQRLCSSYAQRRPIAKFGRFLTCETYYIRALLLHFILLANTL
jgi:hypothetical protein